MKNRGMGGIFFVIILIISVNAQTSVNKNNSQLIPAAGTNSTVQQVNDRTIHLADPTIFFNKGTYYLNGTVEGNASQGFLVYTSNDMKTWKIPAEVKDGYALKKGDAFGDKQFWAPQVFAFNNKFYMAYVANENIAVAESNSPLGPFKQTKKVALAAPVKQIDPFIFIDDDGKKYLYHVRLINGNKLFVAEITDDFSAIKPETLQECINATDDWENTTHAYPVAEGPSILKHKNLYYFVYTANDFRNPDYAVGYAVSSSPYGPWKKYTGNPILSRKNIGRNGTGHGDFIKGDKGNLFYVFHTHNSDIKVAPRTTAIIKAMFRKDKVSGMDKLAVDYKSFYYPVKRDK
jgi:beta-xylosidase